MGLWRGLRRRVRSPAQLWLLMRMTAFVAVIPPLLRLRLPRALRLVDLGRSVLVPAAGEDPTLVASYLEALAGLRRWSFHDNCVVRSLVYYAFLHSRNAPTELRFGVEQGAPAGGPGRRHVWVLRGGAPFRESEPLERYVVVYRHPASER